MSWGVSDLDVRFGRVHALAGVTMDAANGQVTTVVGGDGTGKSTLLRVLVGLLGGDGGEVRRPSRHQIGYLAAGSGVYPDLSVDENLLFSAAAYGLSATEARGRAKPYLRRMDLMSARHRLGGQLSGGMRQKLGVVRAMLHRPALLVLDEPTTGIDPVSRADVWWLISLAAADGAAVVLATTYVEEAQRAASVLVLEGGRVLASGSPAEIVSELPGEVRSLSARPSDTDAARAWRRGRGWRLWSPENPPSHFGGGDVIAPDLEDAVVVASLRWDLAETSGGA